MNVGLYPLSPLVTPLTALPGAAGLVSSVTHGLRQTPSRHKWVMVCQGTDAGYVAGDEVDVGGADSNQFPTFSWGANTTTVFLVTRSTTIRLAHKSTGTITSITNSKWQVKCYYAP